MSPKLMARCRNLARGEVGLVTPGHMYVAPRGQAHYRQIGIHHDGVLSGLAELAEAVHQEGGHICFQLAHAGRQAERKITGQAPAAPSGFGRDPASLNKPRAMTVEEIERTIGDFAAAAARARKAGADAVQIHAAHGYLLSEFLSPFFNRRRDDWSGSDDNRFRLLKEVYLAVRSEVGEDMVVLVKMNGMDHTPKPGITPEIAARYAAWLDELGVDGLEMSRATYYSFHMVAGEVPINELAQALPAWMRPIAKLKFKGQISECAFRPMFNLPLAEAVRPALKRTALILVGGVRGLSEMEEVVKKGPADFISMSRPFVREPMLVKRLREGKTVRAACISCNKCFAAAFNRLPLRCYVNGLP